MNLIKTESQKVRRLRVKGYNYMVSLANTVLGLLVGGYSFRLKAPRLKQTARCLYLTTPLPLMPFGRKVALKQTASASFLERSFWLS